MRPSIYWNSLILSNLILVRFFYDYLDGDTFPTLTIIRVSEQHRYNSTRSASSHLVIIEFFRSD